MSYLLLEDYNNISLRGKKKDHKIMSVVNKIVSCFKKCDSKL